MFNRIIKLWVTLNEKLWGFEVVVEWDGKRYTHAAKSLEEAQDWLRCYPQKARGFVVSFGNDRVVMARNVGLVCA